MSDPKPGLIERLLMRVFEYQDIRDGGDLYLRRFFLYKHPDKTRLTRRLYLHKFYSLEIHQSYIEGRLLGRDRALGKRD